MELSNLDIFLKMLPSERKLCLVEAYTKDIVSNIEYEWTNIEHISSFIKNGRFEKQLNEQEEWVLKGKEREYAINKEKYPKQVWLYSEVLTNTKFRYPLTLNLEDYITIHPGTDRMVIDFLFGKFKQEYLTVTVPSKVPKECTYRRYFPDESTIIEHYNPSDFNTVFTFDSGTITPSFHFDQKVLDDNRATYFNILKNFYSKFSITSNSEYMNSFLSTTVNNKYGRIYINTFKQLSNLSFLELFIKLPFIEETGGFEGDGYNVNFI